MTGPALSAARLRGGAAGLMTGAMTLAAHALGGGTLPGPATAQLVVVAGIVGTVAASLPRARNPGVMLALLAAGQLGGHVLLGAAGHVHAPAAVPGWPMTAAHIAAVGVGALLICAGDRLCRTLARALRAPWRVAPPPVVASTTRSWAGSDQPLRSAFVLLSSISHRGPPAATAR